MTTILHLVRHSESPKTEGTERTRGLTEKGQLDALKVAEKLKNEKIDCFVSSPYRRAILTIKYLADNFGKEIQIFEDLKECKFAAKGCMLSDKEIYKLVKEMFKDKNFSEYGSESFNQCQNRAVRETLRILRDFKGKKIVMGTHGLVMTLILNYFDSNYDYNFLTNTSKPDIYKIEFSNDKIQNVTRI